MKFRRRRHEEPIPQPLEQSDEEHIKLESKPRSRFKRIFTSFILITIIVASVVLVWDSMNVSRASNKMFGSGNLLELLDRGSLKKDNSGRVNVLIAGYSADDPGHEGAKLTDSIILMSMDPSTGSGYLLSIPRDLYLRIPGLGYGKINQVYQEGGMELLSEVVEERLGIRPGYSVLVNYAAVREMVDALGGITVHIDSSDPRGLYDPNIGLHEGGPLQLANGPQQLDGQTALNLTRARGARIGSYGFPRADLTRVQHQKQVLLAIQQKASDWKLALNPPKNGRVLNAAANNLKTDARLAEAASLYRLFSRVSGPNMRSLSLDKIDNKQLLTDGSGGLVPAAGLNDYSQIKRTLQGL